MLCFNLKRESGGEIKFIEKIFQCMHHIYYLLHKGIYINSKSLKNKKNPQ